MSDKRKIAVGTIEMASIIAALNDYGLAQLGTEIHNRFVAADPANDGAETEILVTDPYLVLARKYNEQYPNTPITRETAKLRILGEGYGRQ